MPPWASSKRPFFCGARVGEGAGLVAEQLRLDQALRERRAAHLDERLLRARRGVVDRVRHELLAGARLAADQHGRARGSHLGHLLVDCLHGAAAAHDVADVVALGELAPQLGVLVEEALSLRLHEVVDAHRLADHRAHHPEELGFLVVAAVLLVGQRHPERPDRPVLGPDGHADVGHLVPARAAEDPRAVQEKRLAADLGHHHRPAALRDPAHDPLAEAVAGVAYRRAPPARRLDREVARLVVLEHDGGGERPAALLQDRDDPLECGPQVQRPPEGLADLQEVGQLARVSGARGHSPIMTEMSVAALRPTNLSAGSPERTSASRRARDLEGPRSTAFPGTAD